MSISRVMDKEDVLHIHNGVSLSCFLILKYYELMQDKWPALPCGRCNNCPGSCFWIKLELVLYGLTANSSWFPQQSCNRPIDVTFPHASYPLHPISPGTSLPELQLTNLLLCQPGDSPSTSPGPHLPGLLYPQLQYLLRLLLGRASREVSW